MTSPGPGLIFSSCPSRALASAGVPFSLPHCGEGWVISALLSRSPTQSSSKQDSQEGVWWDGSTLPPTTLVISAPFSTLSPKMPFWATLLLSSPNSSYPDLPLGEGCTCSPKVCLCAFAHTLCIQKPGPSLYHNLTFVLQIQRPCVAFPDPLPREPVLCRLSPTV